MVLRCLLIVVVVSDNAKILILKQITTRCSGEIRT